MDPRYVSRQARHKNILTTLGTYDGGMTPELRKLQMELVSENRSWAKRHADAISSHGRDIMTTGLAGEEFDRI